MIKLKRLGKSFKHAFAGLGVILKTQQNYVIHLIISLAVIAISFSFQIATWQWVVVILLILLVLILEMLNTVFELLVDMLKPRVHQYARDIKNIMAAMVLITAISAVIIGLLIFIPYLIA